jgi:hypothetical protein
MNLETSPYSNHIRKGPEVNHCADVQALVRSVKIAHDKGALFFLAVELGPLLEEHYELNGAITPLDLETLMARVSRAMMS